MATDPVCGMFVDERTAELRLARDRRTYYFCSEHCLREFAQPALELARLRRRLAVAWPLALLILLLTYGVRSPPALWIAFGAATVVQFYPGLVFYRSSVDAARNRSWNMDVLIAVGTSVAYAYSAVVLLWPGRLPPATFFDASSLIVALILSGTYLEHRTRERARGALRRLQELVPATARVLRNGAEVDVPVAEVAVGDRWRVLPGGRFPTDGTIVDGRTSADESLVTGESLPVPKGPGDPVLAGALNGEGPVLATATRVGEDTSLARIGELVTEAETSRIPLQQLADRIAAIFVPVVLALAVLSAAGWGLAGVGLPVIMLVFVSVVITACPCAFGIATPAALVVGTGRAAEEGILFRGRDALESASRVDVVVTDKTGTITEGRPALTDLRTADGVPETELLALADGIEAGSEHPFARAVRSAAAARGVAPSPVRDLRAEPGIGLHGSLDGVPVAVRSVASARGGSGGLGPLEGEAARLAGEGKAVSVVLRAGAPVGVLGFFDRPAPGVPEAIAALRADGIRVVMATGDHEAAARTVARQVGIEEVRAGLTPAGKLGLLRELRAQGLRVAFVGDGVNDAPALAAADVGIAIGSGTDVAREAGGVVLIRSDFRDVALALRIGRRTVAKVKGNLAWAVGYNAVLLPVAMGALVPAFGLGVFSVLPITGALAMGLSSTAVVLNSLSLRWIRLR